jgi:cytoskeleton protein RodZ
MNNDPKIPEIRQNAFAKARVQLGLSIAELAVRACLSARQIEQIENGQSGSFYGAQNKLAAAKKVAAILKIPPDVAFDVQGAIQSEALAKIADPAMLSASQLDREEQLELVQKIKSTEKAILQKSTSQKQGKRLMLSLGICAGLVFAGINFYKNLISEKSEEQQIAVQDQAERTPDPELTVAVLPGAVNSTAAVEAAGEACPSADAAISIYKPEAPRKVGDMVFVQAKSAQVICIVDASGKTQRKTMDQGASASFFGKPPFKVLTSDLNQVDLFFQGAKVRPDNVSSKTILLEPVELAQIPVSPSDDSRLR